MSPSEILILIVEIAVFVLWIRGVIGIVRDKQRGGTWWRIPAWSFSMLVLLVFAGGVAELVGMHVSTKPDAKPQAFSTNTAADVIYQATKCSDAFARQLCDDFDHLSVDKYGAKLFVSTTQASQSTDSNGVMQTHTSQRSALALDYAQYAVICPSKFGTARYDAQALGTVNYAVMSCKPGSATVFSSVRLLDLLPVIDSAALTPADKDVAVVKWHGTIEPLPTYDVFAQGAAKYGDYAALVGKTVSFTSMLDLDKQTGEWQFAGPYTGVYRRSVGENVFRGIFMVLLIIVAIFMFFGVVIMRHIFPNRGGGGYGGGPSIGGNMFGEM